MLHRIDYWISRIERAFCGIVLICMTLLIFGNVVLRFFAGETITFAEDLAIFLMICMSFFAASFATRNDQHITMSALYDLFSGKLRKALCLVRLLVGAGLAALLFVLSLQVTRRIYDLGGEIASMAIPKFLPYLLVSLALFFMMLHFIRLTVFFLQTGEAAPPSEDEDEGLGRSIPSQNS